MSDIGLKEEFEVLEHLEKRLRPLAELARKFHSEGLDRGEFKRLLGLLKEVIEHSTGRSDLPIESLLNVLRASFLSRNIGC